MTDALRDRISGRVEKEKSMNKIYKVVYSRTRNTYQVVSELAKSHGKSSSYGSSGRKIGGGAC